MYLYESEKKNVWRMFARRCSWCILFDTKLHYCVAHLQILINISWRKNRLNFDKKWGVIWGVKGVEPPLNLSVCNVYLRIPARIKNISRYVGITFQHKNLTQIIDLINICSPWTKRITKLSVYIVIKLLMKP